MAEALRFTHIHLENWRNFLKVDVPLESRVFLVGPNASGKSNFLDVFRFLRDIVAIGGGFQQAVRERGGVTRLRCFAARSQPNIVVKVRLGHDENPAVWEYELHFKQDNQRTPLIHMERVLHNDREVLFRPDQADEADPARLTQTYLEQVSINKDFRDAATFFESVRYLHIVPQLVRDPDRSIGQTNDPYGGDFLEQIARTPTRTQESRLRRIRDALMVAVPQLEDLELERDKTNGTPHLKGKYSHWRPKGAWLNEEQLSDGTLRLIGLLWAVLDGDSPLLLEEPELSLHPDVVKVIPQMFARVRRKSGRQFLISTHSPELLQDEGIGLDEVLILQPTENGTSIRPAGDFEDVARLLEGGLNLADIVTPKTRPENVNQLALFGE
ncbi:MAG: AAA family ATPase [Anaerolineae bacterium]|nr:AAA family ATPase [Anaerolineae bacterium]